MALTIESFFLFSNSFFDSSFFFYILSFFSFSPFNSFLFLHWFILLYFILFYILFFIFFLFFTLFHWTYKTYKACKTIFFLKELNLWLIKNTIGTVKISKTENEYHQWVWLDYSAWAILDISIVRNNFLETKLLLSLYRYVYIIENFIVSVIIYHSAVNGARSCLSRTIYALFYSILFVRVETFDYSRKIQTVGFEDILFWRNPWDF